jgi:hypothetical protein
MSNTLFYLDIAIALGTLAFFAFMHYTRRFSPRIWYMFLAGCLIGATWEFGFYLLGPGYASDPLFIMHSEFPLPRIFMHTLHCLWDGGLFMIGVGLVFMLCRPPHLERFRWQELAVMILWGQVSELAVELVGSNGALWEYQGTWYNPVMFRVNDYNITLLPQLVWLAAPVVFYFVALRINARAAGAEKVNEKSEGA